MPPKRRIGSAAAAPAPTPVAARAAAATAAKAQASAWVAAAAERAKPTGGAARRNKPRKTRSGPYKSDLWDEEKEGEQGWGHWHERMWTFENVRGKGGKLLEREWTGTYAQMRWMPKEDDDLCAALIERWKQQRKHQHKRALDGITEETKRVHVPGGNEATKKRKNQPSRQKGYVSAAARAAASEESPAANDRPAQRKKHSTALKGTPAFYQATKRDANALEAIIMGAERERAQEAMDKVLQRPKVQQQLQGSELTITKRERKLLNTVEKGMQAMHEALKKDRQASSEFIKASQRMR